MAELTLNVKATTSITATSTTATQNKYPDTVVAEFTAQNRTIEQQFTLAGGGNKVIQKADFSLATIAFVKIECVTPGQDFNLKFNGDATGIQVAAVSSTQKSFFVSTIDFTQVDITNLDPTNPIVINITAFELAP